MPQKILDINYNCKALQKVCITAVYLALKSCVLMLQVPNLSNMQPILDLTHKLRDAPDSNVRADNYYVTLRFSGVWRYLQRPCVLSCSTFARQHFGMKFHR